MHQHWLILNIDLIDRLIEVLKLGNACHITFTNYQASKTSAKFDDSVIIDKHNKFYGKSLTVVSVNRKKSCVSFHKNNN